MQQEKGQVGILGYFATVGKAQTAAERLKNEGYQEIQIDRVSRFGVNVDAEYNNPIMGRAVSQTGLTLYSSGVGPADADHRILLGADPSVYAMAAHDYGLGGGKSYLVTVVTADSRVDRAVQVMKEEGGYV